MSSSFKQKIVSSFGWQSGITVVQAIVTVIVFAVMARYLDREDFGVVAVANILVFFLQSLTAFGAGAAVVQKPDLDDSTLSAAFWLSLATGSVLAVATFFAADPFSRFMEAELAEPILRVLSVSFLINALSSVPLRMMQRHFDFAYLFTIRFVASVFGYGACGIYAATHGYGAWSIVISTMSMELLMLIGGLLRINTKWHTRGLKDSFRWLLDFATGMSAMAVLNFFASQADRIVVGKRFDVGELGRYVVPLQLALLPGRYVGDILQNVMFPALSRVQTEPEKVNHLFLASIFFSLGLIVPSTLIFIFHAELVIQILFGNKWVDTAPLLRILAVGAIVKGVTRMIDVLAHSQKKLYLNSLVNGASTITLFLAAAIGSLWGLEGVAVGMQLGLFLCLVFSYKLMQHIIGLRIRDFGQVLRPIAVFAAVFVALSSLGSLALSNNDSWLIELIELAAVTAISAAITLVKCRRFLTVYMDPIREMLPRPRQ